MENSLYPCIWCDGNAKALAEFYCSVFKEAQITSENPVVVTFELSGQKFMALNGGPKFTVNPSISFFVVCETEAETTEVWSKLLEGGMALMPLGKYDWSELYGWVQDRFGVTWQISFGKMEDVGQKYTPALMFAGEQFRRAEQAVQFYTSIFKDSSVTGILYDTPENESRRSVVHAQFRIDNYVMMAMDSSLPHPFSFNEAISLVVTCENQEQIDHYWSKLTEGGEESMCGWLKDKFGVFWQIVPSILEELMSDRERVGRVMQAFLQMKKFDIETLIKA